MAVFASIHRVENFEKNVLFTSVAIAMATAAILDFNSFYENARISLTVWYFLP